MDLLIMEITIIAFSGKLEFLGLNLEIIAVVNHAQIIINHKMLSYHLIGEQRKGQCYSLRHYQYIEYFLQTQEHAHSNRKKAWGWCILDLKYYFQL